MTCGNGRPCPNRPNRPPLGQARTRTPANRAWRPGPATARPPPSGPGNPPWAHAGGGGECRHHGRPAPAPPKQDVPIRPISSSEPRVEWTRPVDRGSRKREQERADAGDRPPGSALLQCGRAPNGLARCLLFAAPHQSHLSPRIAAGPRRSTPRTASVPILGARQWGTAASTPCSEQLVVAHCEDFTYADRPEDPMNMSRLHRRGVGAESGTVRTSRPSAVRSHEPPCPVDSMLRGRGTELRKSAQEGRTRGVVGGSRLLSGATRGAAVESIGALPELLCDVIPIRSVHPQVLGGRPHERRIVRPLEQGEPVAGGPGRAPAPAGGRRRRWGTARRAWPRAHRPRRRSSPR